MNTSLTQSHARALEMAYIFTQQGVANCFWITKVLIDSKRMPCHSASAGVINAFFILYALRDIIVPLAPIPPSEYVLKQLWAKKKKNVVSYTALPRGEQNKNNWLIKNRNTSNPQCGWNALRGETKSASEEHRWMDVGGATGNGRGQRRART